MTNQTDILTLCHGLEVLKEQVEDMNVPPHIFGQRLSEIGILTAEIALALAREQQARIDRLEAEVRELRGRLGDGS